jgi:F0F1-type ATP synthase assembly protein I
MFDPGAMTEEEKAEDPAEYRTWFCLGETGMAALLALNIAVPAFFWFAGITVLPLAVTGAAVVFLPVFVFLPKLIRYAMKADTDAVLVAFGKNEQVKKVFWSVFIVLAGLVLAEVVDPATAQKIAEILAGLIP